MPPSWQPYRELRELAHLARDRDRAAVLLGDDLVADRQAKPGALAGRLRREEGLEQLLPVFPGNADTVVAHPDLDRITDFARRNLQHGAERAVARATTLVRGIEAIADKIQEYPHHVLRDD